MITCIERVTNVGNWSNKLVITDLSQVIGNFLRLTSIRIYYNQDFGSGEKNMINCLVWLMFTCVLTGK